VKATSSPTTEGGIADRISGLGRLAIRLSWPFRPALLDAVWAVFSAINLIAIFAFAGQGIPAELLGHIFDRFRGGDSGHPRGTGLGLALVRAVARAHGGDVLVSNRPDRGSEFELRLPAPTRPPALAPASRAGVDAGGKLARKP